LLLPGEWIPLFRLERPPLDRLRTDPEPIGHLEISSSKGSGDVPTSREDGCGSERPRHARTAILTYLAQRVLMQRYGLSAELAATLLRGISRHTNIEIGELAARFVITGEFPDSPKTEHS